MILINIPSPKNDISNMYCKIKIKFLKCRIKFLLFFIGFIIMTSNDKYRGAGYIPR